MSTKQERRVIEAAKKIAKPFEPFTLEKDGSLSNASWAWLDIIGEEDQQKMVELCLAIRELKSDTE